MRGRTQPIRSVLSVGEERMWMVMGAIKAWVNHHTNRQLVATFLSALLQGRLTIICMPHTSSLLLPCSNFSLTLKGKGIAVMSFMSTPLWSTYRQKWKKWLVYFNVRSYLFLQALHRSCRSLRPLIVSSPADPERCSSEPRTYRDGVGHCRISTVHMWDGFFHKAQGITSVPTS